MDAKETGVLSALKVLLDEKLRKIAEELSENNPGSAIHSIDEINEAGHETTADDRFNETIVRLRESSHRESIKEKTRLSPEELNKFFQRQISLETHSIEKLRKGLAHISKLFSEEIEKSSEPMRTGFFDFLKGRNAQKNKITKETADLKTQTQQLNSIAFTLQEECIQKNLELQWSLEKLAASLGIKDQIPLSVQTHRHLAKFRREKLIYTFLSKKIDDTDLLIEKNQLKRDELLQQCDEEKASNRLISAQINLHRIGNPKFRDHFRKPKSPSENDLSILARAQGELSSPAQEEEKEISLINAERLALQEELDELARQLTDLTRRLGNEDDAEGRSVFSVGRSSKSSQANDPT
ncbi:MAG: hypothetical protein RIR26_2145 [Pseudomonadota bacterium]|jgi:hypothetical protein